MSWSVEEAQRLGAALKELRLERGFSQEKLAFSAGITKNQLQLLEGGRASGRRGETGPSNPQMATIYEDEISIGAFYKRFAEATIDTPETREQLFEYFVDKVFIGREQIVIASYFYDSPNHIEFDDLENALTTGNRAGKCEPSLESESSTLPPQVEMPGIEPGSDDSQRSILRAQFVDSCFRLQGSTRTRP